MNHLHPHAEIIQRHGGPTKVAELLGIRDEPGAVQRIWNWKHRGIPAEIRLRHPQLFFEDAAVIAEEPSHA
ncbi:hypothetical protein [Achromobacter kerstersii]